MRSQSLAWSQGGEGLSSPQRTAFLEDLRLLTGYRDQLVRARTQVINRTHKNLVIPHPGYERRIPKLDSKKNIKAAQALLRGDRSVRADLVRDHINEIRRLSDKIAITDKRIAWKVERSGTTLTMLTGTAPVEASSGKTNDTVSIEVGTGS
jgi:hypothetical protein